MVTKKILSLAQARSALIEFYNRNGYKRVPDRDRREEEPQDYKKGYEIRLVANTQRELRMIRQLLRQVELKGGNPFRKVNRWVQPIYGKEAMESFKKWLKEYA